MNIVHHHNFIHTLLIILLASVSFVIGCFAMPTVTEASYSTSTYARPTFSGQRSQSTYGEGIFVAGRGVTGNIAAMIFSRDGLNWDTATATFSTTMQGMVYGNGRFVGVSTNNPRAVYSDDGFVWASSSTQIGSQLNGVTYGNGRFVAVGSTNSRIFTSTDGISWTAVATTSASGNNDTLQGVAYGNGVFVAVGTGPDEFVTSTDGLSWTGASTSVDNLAWHYVTYGGGKFIASSRNYNYFAYSTDGINWATSSIGTSTTGWNKVAYGNGYYVAASCGTSTCLPASTTTIVISEDGVNWSPVAENEKGAWRTVTYGNGRFLIVGDETYYFVIDTQKSISQAGFRFRADNGTETSASYVVPQNAATTTGYGQTTRLRIQTHNPTDATTHNMGLEYRSLTDSRWYQSGVDDLVPRIVTSTTSRTTGNAVTRTVPVPECAYGNLLLAVISYDGVGPATTTAGYGWTMLNERSNALIVSSVLFWKYADGDNTLIVNTAATEESSHLVYCIENGGVPTASGADGSSTNSNPPIHRTGANRSTLWIATRSGDAQVVATAVPPGYMNLITLAANTTGGASINAAHQYLSSSTTDPGTFTSATEQWVSFTIAVPPRHTPTVGSMAMAQGTTSTSTNNTGFGTIAWTNSQHATTSNNVRATVTLSSTTASNHLTVTGLGLQIPSAARILGIEAMVEKTQTGGTAGNVRDSSIRLMKNGTTSGVTNLAQTAVNWQLTSDYVITYGSTTELWGTTWTPSDINNSGFGLAIAVAGAAVGANRVANIDNVIINVYYTVGDRVFIASSVNITDNATTTPQLILPGKTAVSSFTPGYTIDASSFATTSTSQVGAYSEFEWVVMATSTATTGDTFMMRLSAAENGGIDWNRPVIPLMHIGTSTQTSQLTLSGTMYADTGSTTVGVGNALVAMIGDRNPILQIATTSSGGTFSTTFSVSTGTPSRWPVSTFRQGVVWQDVQYANGKYIAVGGSPNGASTTQYAFSEDGLDWQYGTIDGLVGSLWQSVTYAEGKFVAVGPSVAYSLDGKNWIVSTNPDLLKLWNSVTYGNGRFVAVGDGVSSDSVIYSDNGQDWVLGTALGDNDTWNSVTYGNGRFVAVGSGSGVERAMYSFDGITWQSASAAGNNDIWYDVTYGNGRFVAVGIVGPDVVMTSTDGITWATSSALANDDNWEDVTYGNGRFVAVGQSLESDQLMTSFDGLTWTAAAFNLDYSLNIIDWKGVTYGNGRFVAVGADYNLNGNGFISLALAPFGDTAPVVVYSQVPTTTATTYLEGYNGNGTISSVPVYKETLLVTHAHGNAAGVIGMRDASIYDSDDEDSILFNTNIERVDLLGEVSVPGFAVDANFITATGTHQLPHRLRLFGDWSQRGTILANGGVVEIVPRETRLSGEFTGTSSLYQVAILEESGVGLWQQLPNSQLKSVNGLLSVAKDETDGGDFVIIGFDENSGQSETIVCYGFAPNNCAPGGISTSLMVTDVVYGEEKFVAVTGQNIYDALSVDLSVNNASDPWTPGVLAGGAVSAYWLGVTYGNGRFVAVGIGDSLIGSGNKGMYSDDGENWIISESIPDVFWYDVTYGNGRFVAVGAGDEFGSGVKVAYSDDGISWSSSLLPSASNTYFTVTFVDNYFVAAGVGSSSIIYSYDGINWTESPYADSIPHVISMVPYGESLLVTDASNQIHQISDVRSVGKTLINNTAELSSIDVLARPANSIILNELGVVRGIDNRDILLTTTPGYLVSAIGNVAINSPIVIDTLYTPRIEGYGVSIETPAPLNLVTFNASSTIGEINNVRVANNALMTINKHAGTSTVNGNCGQVVLAASSTVYCEHATSLTVATGTAVDLVGNIIDTLNIQGAMTSDSFLYGVGSSTVFSGNLTQGIGTVGVGYTGIAEPVTVVSETTNISDVVEGEGRMVAVLCGDVGSGCDTNVSTRVLHSVDGYTWSTTTAAGDNDNWRSLTYGNGRFVAVGVEGDRVMYSDDGLSWVAVATTSAAGNNDMWLDVTYGNGRFVAVGIAGDRVMYSTNGQTWTAGTILGDNDTWYEVTYGNGRFVAVGQGDQIAYSDDGITWVAANTLMAPDMTFQSVTYGNGRFVTAALSASNTEEIFYSLDGNNWATSTFSSALSSQLVSSNYSVIFVNGYFAAMSFSRASSIYFSVDGNTWDYLFVPGYLGSYYKLAKLDDKIAAFGFADSTYTAMSISPMSLIDFNPSLTLATTTITNNLSIEFGELYAPTSSLDVNLSFANAYYGKFHPRSGLLRLSGQLYGQTTTLDDVGGYEYGVTEIVGYTEIPFFATTSALRIATGSDLVVATSARLVVAHGLDNDGQLIFGNATSSTLTLLGGNLIGSSTATTSLGVLKLGGASVGTAWATTSVAGNNDIIGEIIYANDMFVAVGISGDRAYYSYDGLTWATSSAAENDDLWAALTYGNGRFVALAYVGDDKVMYSDDGITWTTVSAAGNNDVWSGVTYGEGKFVAVAGPLSDRSMYSYDGINWATTSPAGNNDTWQAVTYGNGRFVAVSSGGDRAMYSEDGIAWATTSIAGNNDTWNSVTYGNGRFVAVASTSAATGGESAAYSFDGITWTAVSAFTGDWTDVTYGNGYFYAITNDTNYPTPDADVMRSPDGITWELISVPVSPGFNDWRALGYGAGKLVAVGGASQPTDVTMMYSDAEVDARGRFDVQTLTIASSSIVNLATTTIKLVGNYQNNGTLNSSSSQVILAGTETQTLNGRLSGASAFNNLTVENTSGNGTTTQSVHFNAPVDVRTTFRMNASTSARFLANSTSTFGNIDWSGGSTTSEVWLRSSVDGTRWYVDVTGTQSVAYVNVRDSNASLVEGGIIAATSTNVGNNTNWFFGGEPAGPTITLEEASAGQIANKFNFQDAIDTELVAFRLVPNNGNATITAVTVVVTGAQNINPLDFTNIRVVFDSDNDSVYDVGSDVVIVDGGSFSLNGQIGQITFNESGVKFEGANLLTGPTNFIVIANWNAPQNNSFMTLDIIPSGIVATSTIGQHSIIGGVSSVQHARTNRTGGGVNTQIGDPAPTTTPETGGGDTGGEQIGENPNFFWPTSNLGESGALNSPQNAYDRTDGTFATTTTGVTHSFGNLGFGVPGGNTITGIEVKVEVSATVAGGTIDLRLSPDGGAALTTAKNSPSLTTSDVVLTFGGPSDLWGRAWSPTEFANGNFELHITTNPSGNTIRIDAIQIRVYHQTTGGGGGGGGEI